MLTISSAVQEVLFSDGVAQEALRQDLLNLSAYAKRIHAQVEQKTMKEVQTQTIVVALSRLAEKVKSLPGLHPEIILDELSIKAPLCDITFERTEHNLLKAQSLSDILLKKDNQFLTVTMGNGEITVISAEENAASILEHFRVTPKACLQNLVGITVKFSSEYLTEANIVYGILSTLAIYHINLLEIVSTYTEIAFIIEKSQMEVAIAALNRFFRKTK